MTNLIKVNFQFAFSFFTRPQFGSHNICRR